MNISIAICTYNRINLLKKAIASILCQDIILQNQVKWEVIIIDNNSIDGTAEYVKQLVEDNEHIKYFLEEKQGIGYARNTALSMAIYDIVAYLDDDEWVDKNWAQEILRVFAENADVGCVGGPCYLEDQDTIPTWIPSDMYGILGDVWLKTEKKDYFETGRCSLGGGNLAINKKAVLSCGIKFPLLGRRGELLLADEDREMCYAIHAAGLRIFYNPRAIAYHALLLERVTIRYFLKNVKGMAYTRARKRKAGKYFFELIWFLVIFPIKVILNYKKRTHYFFRIVSAFYKLQAAIKGN